MRHRKSLRKFNRSSSHRKSMMRNLAISFIRHGKIRTTCAKAKDLRPYIEKMVTIGKKDTLHSRRLLISRLNNKEAVDKLIKYWSPMYLSRPGGYTRIIKMDFRKGDNSSMAFFSFV